MLNPIEYIYLISWWAVFACLGLISLPLTNKIFSKFADSGYLFSKVLGIGISTYLLFVLNVLHVLPFGLASIILVFWIFALFNVFMFKKGFNTKNISFKLIIFEEILFAVGIFFWAWIRAHEPSINGLEKFMDFGFVNSILRTTYQPAVDMWFTPLPINYYYFGHLITAVVTKASLVPAQISYNLMIATLFSFTFTLTFSISLKLISTVLNKKAFLGGILTAALVTFAGNLHTIYAFFKAYDVNNPVPFWNLPLLINSFPNAYWYPNATRFIPFTIHEFPLYSFVVSDLHGHVLDIPFVLLTIAISYIYLTSNFQIPKSKPILNFKFLNLKLNFSAFTFHLSLLAFLLAVMYMTNVWDGLIYMVLLLTVMFIKEWQVKDVRSAIESIVRPAALIIILFFIFTLPFNLSFKPFASGVGLICAPHVLTNLKKVGPFLFEADHCQRSAIWQLATLYGFFYFFVVSFIIFIRLQKNKFKVLPSDIFIFILILISTLLIIFPEFFYLKDIYPQHYRANTMFKLVYQAFIMLSISSGYIILRISNFSYKSLQSKLLRFIFILFTVSLLSLVFIFPYYAINSYYADLKTYSGIDGLKYLQSKRPEDYAAINWINQNISGRPVILEAQGDSYTDYERISANTGLPTVLGWTVHEWLWRGSYDIPAPRISEVIDLYQSKDIKKTKNLINKYKIEYVYIGGLEHEKYPSLDESKFKKLGKVVFQSGNTKIYKLGNSN